MNKFSKVALLVSAAISAQTFAADAGKLDIEVYGKVGTTAQLDADELGQLDSRTDEDFKAYQDSKLGLKLGYGVNKNFSIHSEIKADYESKDVEVRLQELFVKAEVGRLDLEVGRFRTPLYMNSVNQDNDYELNTYRGVRGFSTQDETTIHSALETVDGFSIGFNNDLSFGKSEVRAFAGQAKDREHGTFNGSETFSFETTADNIFGLESSIDSEFGKIRLAYLEADIFVTANEVSTETLSFDSLSLGYKFTKNQFFVDAEVALEELAIENPVFEGDKVETRKGYVTMGMNVGALTPTVTYSHEKTEFVDEPFKSVEVGFAYDVHKNVRLKTAYEYVDMGNNVDDTVVSIGAAFKF